MTVFLVVLEHILTLGRAASAIELAYLGRITLLYCHSVSLNIHRDGPTEVSNICCFPSSVEFFYLNALPSCEDIFLALMVTSTIIAIRFTGTIKLHRRIRK